MTRTVAIDFFCGAGGMTNGLIRAGFHVLAGIDNEPLCEQTYLQNKNPDGSQPAYLCKNIFPKSTLHPTGQQCGIAEDISALIDVHHRKHGIRKSRLVFAICAPCQPFTKITRIAMSEGRQFKRDNDSDLLITTVALVKQLRPDAIICENVEGIGGGESSVLARFGTKLRRLGYAFDAKVINAAQFGVPQNRKRTIGIAFDRNRYSCDFEVLSADPLVKRHVSVAEAISHLPPLASGECHGSVPNHRARALSDLNLKRISSAPPGGSNEYLRTTKYGDLSLACHARLETKNGKRSFSDTYTRMRGDEVAPTMTTKSMSISNGRFGHYDTAQNRALTPREAALLQTFPARYVFHPEENIEFAAKLIGNAVPPKLAKFFGTYLLDRLI